MVFLESGNNIINNALTGIESLKKIIISDVFNKIVNDITECKGKIVLTGIGKSGYIAGKIASTLSSLGVPSIFLHPSEASHGDLGMIQPDDYLIGLSKSGNSAELLDIFYFYKENKYQSVLITMDENSDLAKIASCIIKLENILDGIKNINCPMSSMSSMLVLGDTIAACVAEKRNFTKSEYAKLHPGGKLGKSSKKISEIMRTSSAIPLVKISSNFNEIILEISSKMLGITGVLNENNQLVGVITDGDIRRCISKVENNNVNILASNIMSKDFKYININTHIDDAINFLTQNKITSSLILDENGNIVGATNIHDLLNYSK